MRKSCESIVIHHTVKEIPGKERKTPALIAFGEGIEEEEKGSCLQ